MRRGEHVKKQEKEYYPLIKTKLEDLLETRTANFYLEITANKKFSNKLKAEIREGRDIIFNFLKEASPDITGFIKNKYSSDFIVVEFKRKRIKLDDIYQARKYRDLFGAKFTFLVSLESIPEEIKRLHKVIYPLLSSTGTYEAFVLVHFNEENVEFEEWYPDNPFEKDLYWK